MDMMVFSQPVIYCMTVSTLGFFCANSSYCSWCLMEVTIILNPIGDTSRIQLFCRDISSYSLLYLLLGWEVFRTTHFRKSVINWCTVNQPLLLSFSSEVICCRVC